MSARDTPLATDPLAGHRIADAPFYQAAGAEADWFETACRHHLPVLLKGPTGCGKTRFVEYMAWRMGLPLIQVACNDDTSAADLTGRHLLDADGTYWADGPLTLAARHGAICYLDEIVEARPDATVVIHPLTDSRRVLPLDRLGEVVHAHPDFHLVISYNPGYHGEHRRLKPSTRQRFVAIDFGYPDAAHEADVIVRESGADRDTARRLVDLAHRTRALAQAGNGLDEGASTRLLVHAARLIVAGLPPLDACRIAISDAATDDADTRVALQTMAAAHFAT